MLHIVHQRLAYRKDRTLGGAFLDGQRLCYTLEDELRELPGCPVSDWKIDGKTAIPAGTYQLELVDSPHHGKDTLQLKGVPGFQYIHIHAGNTENDTEGCVLVGFEIDTDEDIKGGTSKPALVKLKALLVPKLKAGEEVIWDVRNPAGYCGPDEATLSWPFPHG